MSTKTIIVFRNYFNTAFRNLWKNKAYSFLNISGLAIGIACAALIFLWVESELTFNHYFVNRDNLYKIKDRQTYSGSTYTFDATPGLLAAAIKAEVPGIKETARCTNDQLLFSKGDKEIFGQGSYVDSPFLKMFGWQFVAGNPAGAFSQLYSVVITEKFADKFFDKLKNDNYGDLIGKTLKVDNKQDYMITGVVKDPPENVSLRFDWLAPFQIYEKDNPWLKQWGNNSVSTYVELSPHANISAINKKLYNFVEEKAGGDAIAKMSVYPMNRWRLYDSFSKNGKETEGRIKFVRLFSLIAWIILIIACINFMNLATARSEQRAREVGVRKVLGAVKSGLIGQFLVESLLLSLLSTLLAIAIIFITLPAFNTLVEKQLAFHPLDPLHLLALLVIAIVCGLIAGSYPAFYLSSFRPVAVLKSMKLKLGAGAGFIRKGLVVLQFAVSITFVISTIIIYRQIRHVKDRDLGYNRQHLINMNVQGNMAKNFSSIKNDLLQTGAVENAALSTQTILQDNNNSGSFNWEGKNPKEQLLISMNFVSPEFIPAMGIKISEGRNFNADGFTDTSNIIINETMAKAMHVKSPLGSLITWDNKKYAVVGIVHDFIYNNMYETPSPLIFLCGPSPDYFNFLSVRLKQSANAEDLTASLSKIETVLKKDNPGYPFQYKFVDAQFDQLFKTEALMGKLAGIFAFLAIMISCLGLFGLAAYTAERRTKEMGIRKVLGATAGKLVILLSKDFLQLVVISFLLAFPVAWWIMHNWLQNYEYRIKIHWWIFLSAGALAVLIAVFTVSFQAIKAAIANPVESLRME